MAIARVRTVFTGVAGSPYWSNLYFDVVPDQAQAEIVSDLVVGLWDDLDTDFLSALTATVQSEVASIDEATGNLLEVFPVTGGAVVGLGGTEGLPAATQGLVRFLTDEIAGGRRIRGRCFLPSQLEANSALGVPSSAWRSAKDVRFNELIGEAEQAGSPLCVWSRKNGISANVTTASTWNQWAVLRSRRD